MTQAELRRKYSRLVGLVERQAHSKFKRRPALIFVNRVRRPKNRCRMKWQGEKVVKVTRAQILIPKRMARDYEKLAELMIAHELRENLAFQNGNSQTKGHWIARRNENAYRRKLGIKEASRTLLKRYYGR